MKGSILLKVTINETVDILDLITTLEDLYPDMEIDIDITALRSSKK